MRKTGMPQSECIRIRLKPGMTDKFLEWTKQIPDRMDEVRVTMREQGIIAEHIFLERTPERDFIIFYCKAEDMAKTKAVFQNSDRKIDLEMIEMIDLTWDRSHVSRLQPVLEF
jgi:hypothetical protein